MSAPSVKVHNVTLHLGDGDTRSFLVKAQTAAGAKRDVIRLVAALATVELATGEQLYHAGKIGQNIIGHGDDGTLDSDVTAKDAVDAAAAILLHGYGLTKPDHLTIRANSESTENAHAN